MIDVAGEPPVPARIVQILSDPALAARQLCLPDPQTLYETDTPAKLVYYLESGQVRIYQVGPENAERLSDILGPGAWFGTAAIAGHAAHGSRAQVVSASTVWEMDRQKLLDWLTTQPETMRDLLTQLARRLQSARAAAAGLVFHDCSMRLVRTLLDFSKTAAAIPSEHGVVLRITHQELADAVGAARETISLALTQLRRQNLLRTGRNRLTFDPQALRDFSESQRTEGRKTVTQEATAPGQ
jgi:CRP/FNR family transcriptional regulator